MAEDQQWSNFMMPPHAAFTRPIVLAYLYNPPVDEIALRYPYKDEEETVQLKPSLVLTGNGLPNGSFPLAYRVETSRKTVERGETKADVVNGWFETRITPKNKFPNATGVSWNLSTHDRPPISGKAHLSWSRFRGQVKYHDEKWRSTYIDMRPVTWGSPTNFTVPVSDDGHFDALVPSRVYAVVNVNGTGYGYDALERWAWDYDLTRDREDMFVIGRTELYGMRAFDINGGPPTIFVMFRPTSLSRILRFDNDADGLVQGEDRKTMVKAMKESSTVISPELTTDYVKIWLNGQKEEVIQLNQIPEYDGDHWQAQYLAQIFPEHKPARRVWHEIRVEVRSKEELHGKEVVDFGEGSVGLYRA
jgi:hypothetical protein